MCGIYGMVGAGAEAALPRMSAALVHRGPDGDGWAMRGPGGVGCRRLAIIDVAGGAQPLANETGDVIAVCNGEIYNHAALRAALQARGHRFRTRSDAEVLPHLYEDRGVDFVDALDGMFGLALWDARRGRLVLARYWEVAPFLAAPPLPLGLDEAAAELRAHLVRAVRAQLVSDVPLGVFLSGGLDSTAVTAVTRSVGGELNTFALGFAEGGFDESDHAALAARAAPYPGTAPLTPPVPRPRFWRGRRRSPPQWRARPASARRVPPATLASLARRTVKGVGVGGAPDELCTPNTTHTNRSHHK